ncbi:Smr/MutS family protein [Tenacibaculum piscium]|uniref:DNA mismatch repair protein MutS n=1 Tax=Tenacibaculum piscium TaxID=1458515 RepID=A0A2H1YG04_9FLAO|nr:Smr/MutS family protein [Tenacibaculum piscium]MBE7629724.1 DNA mismatch repair protein MutS [Tenacibaculum piscium]MBE7671517.1 DNA mismatch repair protein MutS [Tenacibaculum piscium]MBE7685364.1 DNA mismatch repair protein MutS [Tenacibaculum piscium]MBE7690640.1 DNA mismatch repair protein MutS [Tenacibaculum piscium]MCG8182559.1 Smr/MutS family protein [Tenacibaculum piscium]
MCLEIGNKVAVLDADIRGIITRKENDFFFVKDQHGMEYSFYATELVKIKVEQHELSRQVAVQKSLWQQKTQETVKKKKSFFVKDKNEVIMEVDLHADKLVKSTRGMDNYDILSLQLETAKHKLEYCISKSISKLVLIHGIGEGVLKTELDYLLNNYSVKYYDASYQKYGKGATEIYIYQNPN